jgi:hypothetical protein
MGTLLWVVSCLPANPVCRSQATAAAVHTAAAAAHRVHHASSLVVLPVLGNLRLPLHHAAQHSTAQHTPQCSIEESEPISCAACMWSCNLHVAWTACWHAADVRMLPCLLHSNTGLLMYGQQQTPAASGQQRAKHLASIKEESGTASSTSCSQRQHSPPPAAHQNCLQTAAQSKPSSKAPAAHRHTHRLQQCITMSAATGQQQAT